MQVHDGQPFYRMLQPKEWQLKFLFRQGPGGWSIHILVVLLTAFSQEWPLDQRLSWLAAMLVLSICLFVICSFGNRGWFLEALGYAHTISTGLVALVWSAGAFLAVRHSYEGLLFYSLALGGTALGAVSAQHSVIRSCLVSIWLSVPGLALAHALAHQGTAASENSAMILAYALVLSMLAIRLHTSQSESHNLADMLLSQIEESRTLRLEADRMAEEKTRFVAFIGHDLRQPVHAIGLQTEALKALDLKGEARLILDQIDVTVRNLANLFQSLLELSALELNRLKSRNAVFDLGVLVNELVEQNRLAAELGGGTIRAFNARSVLVSSDRALLGTILQNLIGNAVKHAPGCRISIGIRSIGPELCLWVLDRGPGMSQQKYQLIFGELNSATPPNMEQVLPDRVLPSFGLGLPLVLRIGKLLGLSIKCIPSPGRGTLFKVSGLIQTNQTEASAARQLTQRLRNLRVAVLDDDDASAAYVKSLLERWGCNVLPIEPDLLRASNQIDVLIADRPAVFGAGNAKLSPSDIPDSLTGLQNIILLENTEVDTEMPFGKVANTISLQRPVRAAQLRAALTSLAMKVQ